MEEIWKDIIEVDGKYQISNLGRVRNKKHVLKSMVNKQGYIRVSLYNNGIKKRLFGT